MAGIAMIQATDPRICRSDHFLNSLQWVESMENINPSYMTPTSPVFKEPKDPYSDNDYIDYHYYCLISYYYDFYLHNRHRHMKISKNQYKKNFKNQNKFFRKNGHLKQPGGASCNQRR